MVEENSAFTAIRPFMGPCGWCKRPRQIAWVESYTISDRGSPSKIPLDPYATVYVVFKARDQGGRIACLPARSLMDHVATITLDDGRILDKERLLGFFVTHYANCSGVDRNKNRPAASAHAPVAPPT